MTGDFGSRIVAALYASADEALARQCHVMFCANDKHEGDQHSDVTGHTWTEATPDAPVIAHVYTVGSDSE